MLISRLIPKTSNNYKSLNEKIDLYYNFLISNHLTCLFAVWSLAIAGYVYLLGQIDRYSYWDWNGFYEGAIKLIISTVLFYVFVRANLLKQEKNRLSYIDIIFNSGYYFSFFIIGTIRIDSADISLSGYVPYFSFILAAILFYEYKISYDVENDDWNVDSWENTPIYMGSSIILIFTSFYLGYVFDDPVISTVSIVSIFFPLVMFVWPNHVRHVKRLQFFPLFTFAMFACIRAPWFFIFLLTLFFIVRTINYLKFGIVYPSFGVHLEEISDDV